MATRSKRSMLYTDIVKGCGVDSGYTIVIEQSGKDTIVSGTKASLMPQKKPEVKKRNNRKIWITNHPSLGTHDVIRIARIYGNVTNWDLNFEGKGWIEFSHVNETYNALSNMRNLFIDEIRLNVTWYRTPSVIRNEKKRIKAQKEEEFKRNSSKKEDVDEITTLMQDKLVIENIVSSLK